MDARYPGERVALVDLLDRVLASGVVVTGEITLSVADVDLVTVSLRALLASTAALAGPDARQGDRGITDGTAHAAVQARRR